MQLQNNRFTVILGCITIDTAMLGWIASNPGNWYWEISSCLLIIFLICGCLLTWIMGRYTTKIAAYLEVFHEQSINKRGWESRNRVFWIKNDKYININNALAIMYLIFCVMSIFIPFKLCKSIGALIPSFSYLFILVLILYLLMLYFMIFKSTPRDKYIAMWKNIKDEEE